MMKKIIVFQLSSGTLMDKFKHECTSYTLFIIELIEIVKCIRFCQFNIDFDEIINSGAEISGHTIIKEPLIDIIQKRLRFKQIKQIRIALGNQIILSRDINEI